MNSGDSAYAAHPAWLMARRRTRYLAPCVRYAKADIGTILHEARCPAVQLLCDHAATAVAEPLATNSAMVSRIPAHSSVNLENVTTSSSNGVTYGTLADGVVLACTSATPSTLGRSQQTLSGGETAGVMNPAQSYARTAKK